LEHAASCKECRSILGEYSALADELLLLAPGHEPSAGFEGRVVERMGGRFVRPRWRPRLRAALAVVAVAALTVGVMFAAFRDDRQDARSQTAQLQEPDGGRAGEVIAYDTSPPWLLVKVAHPYRSSEYKCELVTRSGRRIRLPAFQLDEASGTWGQAIPVSLNDVAEVRVFDGDGEGALRARFQRD
jgi:hypothetical protein